MQDIIESCCYYSMERNSAKAIVIYDGECDFCQASKDWIAKRALSGRFEFISCQSDERKRRFPSISTEQCMTAIQLVLEDGNVYSGAEAIPEILNRLEGWRWLEKIMRWPLIKKASPLVYRWVARNRGFISCVFRPGTRKQA